MSTRSGRTYSYHTGRAPSRSPSPPLSPLDASDRVIAGLVAESLLDKFRRNRPPSRTRTVARTETESPSSHLSQKSAPGEYDYLLEQTRRKVAYHDPLAEIGDFDLQLADASPPRARQHTIIEMPQTGYEDLHHEAPRPSLESGPPPRSDYLERVPPLPAHHVLHVNHQSPDAPRGDQYRSHHSSYTPRSDQYRSHRERSERESYPSRHRSPPFNSRRTRSVSPPREYSRDRPQAREYETFSGQPGEDAVLFLRRVDRQRRVSKFSGDQIVGIMGRLMTGQAKTWYDDLDERTVENWELFQQALLNTYGPTAKWREYSRKLDSRVYTTSDTPATYGSDIRHLGISCDLQGIHLMRAFCRGLSVQAANYVYRKKCLTIDEAVEALCEFTDLYPTSPIPHPDGARGPVNVPHIHTTQVPTPPTLAAVNTPAQPSKSKPYKGSKYPPCGVCNKTGHPQEKCYHNYFCSHCQCTGHLLHKCKWAARGEIPPVCDLCHKKGHTADKCRSAQTQANSNPQIPPLNG